MDSVQRAFTDMSVKPLKDMTERELIDLQWLVMQALKAKVCQ